MKPAVQMIRLVTAVLASAVGAGFVLGYNDVRYHNAVEHWGGRLPAPTGLVAAMAPYAFAVPIVLLVAGILLRRRETAVTLIVSVGWLFAIAWALLCILVWEETTILL